MDKDKLTTGLRHALARCHECWSEEEGTDVPPALMEDLVAAGWLRKRPPGFWQVTDAGQLILVEMGVT